MIEKKTSKKLPRKKTRDSLKIWFWMRTHSHSYTSIARDLGYKNHTPVWRTVHEDKNIRKILRWLVDKGCPLKYLNLPKDMEQ